MNAANPTLLGGGGVDGAIHRAGGPAILEECKAVRLRRMGSMVPTGQAVVTSGGNLKARYVIHTVGPVWHGGRDGEAEKLEDAYRNSLKLAVDKGLKSVSFPSISTGAYGYPVQEAARVALTAVLDFLEPGGGPEEIVFVLHDPLTLSVYEGMLKDILMKLPGKLDG